MTPDHAAALLSATLAIGISAPAGHYPDAPPPAHTGGFGEPTCRACHFEHPLNATGASLEVQGWPEEIVPDSVYSLTVRVSREGIGAAGFQMSARFATGPAAGSNAGVLRSLDGRAAVVRDGATGIAYAQHVESSTTPTSGDVAEWVVAWVAPPSGEEAVALHVAANAANGDASEFGDLIHALERVTNDGRIDESSSRSLAPRGRRVRSRCGPAGGRPCQRAGACPRRHARP